MQDLIVRMLSPAIVVEGALPQLELYAGPGHIRFQMRATRVIAP